VLQRLHRPSGFADDGGHLGRGEPGGHAQQQHLALVGGQLPHGGQHPLALDPVQRELRRVHRPAGQAASSSSSSKGWTR
jgi:hypothetical protein